MQTALVFKDENRRDPTRAGAGATWYINKNIRYGGAQIVKVDFSNPEKPNATTYEMGESFHMNVEIPAVTIVETWLNLGDRTLINRVNMEIMSGNNKFVTAEDIVVGIHWRGRRDIVISNPHHPYTGDEMERINKGYTKRMKKSRRRGWNGRYGCGRDILRGIDSWYGCTVFEGISLVAPDDPTRLILHLRKD